MDEYDYWNHDAQFLTFTYDQEHLPEGYSLRYKDFQDFMKRIRKESGKSLKYFVCGEYGSQTSRPHYHAIIFGLNSEEDVEMVKRQWFHGNVDIGYAVTRGSCGYVAQYTLNKINGKLGKFIYKDREAPFMRCSKGIGERYALDNKDALLNACVQKRGIHKTSIPRYYHNKIGVEDRGDLYYTFILKENEKLIADMEASGIDYRLKNIGKSKKADIEWEMKGNFLDTKTERILLSPKAVKYINELRKQLDRNLKAKHDGKRFKSKNF